MIAPREASGPIRFKRGPSKKRRALRGGYFVRREGPQPAEIVAAMQAAGAEFYIHADEARTAFRYAYRIGPGKDVDRLRQLVAQAKADEDLHSLVKVEIFAAIIREAMDLPPPTQGAPAS